MVVNISQENNKYAKEKIIIKIFLMIIFLSNILIYNVAPYLGYQICEKFVILCDSYFYVKFFFFSWIFVPLFSIFFIKKYYNKWRILMLLTLIFSILNLLRDPLYNDYLLIGPRPTTIYIYIISTVVSIFYIYKERRWGVFKR